LLRVGARRNFGISGKLVEANEIAATNVGAIGREGIDLLGTICPPQQALAGAPTNPTVVAVSDN
jgi:hypothetical protein